MCKDYVNTYLKEVRSISRLVNIDELTKLIQEIEKLKKRNGRLFILGVGGSAGNASHAVNDFRKIMEIEAYAPTDNVSELTARVNDDGWDTTVWKWLQTSKLKPEDALLIFSVGGGSATTSQNLVKAMEYGQEKGCRIFSVVSRDGGKAKELSNCCILIPVVEETRITPHAEEWQGIVWHMIINYFKK